MSSNDVTGMNAAGEPSPEFIRTAPVHPRTSQHDALQTEHVSQPILRGIRAVPSTTQTHRVQLGSRNQKIGNVVAPHFARAGRGGGTQTVHENSLEEVANLSTDAPPQSYLIRTAGQPKVPITSAQTLRISVGISPEQSPVNKESSVEAIKAFKDRAKEVKISARLYHSEAANAHQRAIASAHRHPLSKSPNPQEICDYSTRQLTIKQAKRDMAFSALVHANRDRQHTYANWLLEVKGLELANTELSNLPKKAPPNLSLAEWEGVKETAKIKVKIAEKYVAKSHDLMQKANGIYKKRFEEYTVVTKDLLEQTVNTLKVFENQSQIVYRELKEGIPKNDGELSTHRQYVLFATNIASKINTIIEYNKNHPNAINTAQYEKLLKEVLKQFELPLSRSKDFLKVVQKEVDSAEKSLTDFETGKKGALTPEQALQKTFYEYTLAQKKYILAQKQTYLKGAQFAVDLIEFSLLKSQPTNEPKTFNPVKDKLEASLLQNDQAETNEAAAKKAYMKAKEKATVDPKQKRMATREYLVAASQEEFFKFLQARNLTAYFAGKIAQGAPVRTKYTSAQLDALKAKNAYMMAMTKLRSTQTVATSSVLQPGRVTARPSRPPPNRAPDATQSAQMGAISSPTTTTADPTNAASARPLPPGFRRPLPPGPPPIQTHVASSLPPEIPPSTESPTRLPLGAPPTATETTTSPFMSAVTSGSLPIVELNADQKELLELKEKNAELKTEIDALKTNSQPDQEKIRVLEAQYEKNLAMEARLLRKELARQKSEIDQMADNDPSKASKLELYEVKRLEIWSKFPKTQSERVLGEIVSSESSYLEKLLAIRSLSKLYKNETFKKYIEETYPDKAEQYKAAFQTMNENIDVIIAASQSFLYAAKEGLAQFQNAKLPEDKYKAADRAFEELRRVFSQQTTSNAYVAYVDAFEKQAVSISDLVKFVNGSNILKLALGDNADLSGATLNGYFIFPIQRIPRYEMLLDDFSKTAAKPEELGLRPSDTFKTALETTTNVIKTPDNPLKGRLLHAKKILEYSLSKKFKLGIQNDLFGHDTVVCVERKILKSEPAKAIRMILNDLLAAADKNSNEDPQNIIIAQDVLKALKNHAWAKRVITNPKSSLKQLFKQVEILYPVSSTRPVEPSALPTSADKLQAINITLSSVAKLVDAGKDSIEKLLKRQGFPGNARDILDQAFIAADEAFNAKDPSAPEMTKRLLLIIKRCPWTIAEIHKDASLFNKFVLLQARLGLSQPPIAVTSNPQDFLMDWMMINNKFKVIQAALRLSNLDAIELEDLATQFREHILIKGIDLHAMLTMTKDVLKASHEALDSRNNAQKNREWEKTQELASGLLQLLIQLNDVLKIPGFQEKIDEVKPFVKASQSDREIPPASAEEYPDPGTVDSADLDPR